MSTRILIVLVVIVVLLAVVAVVLGANRKSPDEEEAEVKAGNTGFAPVLERVFGWMTPGFDLDDLTVSGATLDREKRTLQLKADQQVTLTVKAKPGADPNDCRSLTLALKPPVTGTSPEVIHLQRIELRPPLPEGFDAPDDGKQFLPVPPPDEDDDAIAMPKMPKKTSECAIPVFRGGATIVLVAKRACTLEIR